MQENWEMFFDMLIKHEGGFTDDQRDNGNAKGDGHGNEGSTMWGVTAWNWAKYTGKPAPKEVMKALTKEDVKPLYKKNYWDVIHADKLPSGVDISVADMTVNAGPSRAAKILQKATGGLTVDGAIGKMTIAAVHDRDPKEVLDNYYYGRQKFYESLDDFQHYGKGWTRRNKETLELALSIV